MVRDGSFNCGTDLRRMAFASEVAQFPLASVADGSHDVLALGVCPIAVLGKCVQHHRRDNVLPMPGHKNWLPLL